MSATADIPGGIDTCWGNEELEAPLWSATQDSGERSLGSKQLNRGGSGMCEEDGIRS